MDIEAEKMKISQQNEKNLVDLSSDNHNVFFLYLYILKHEMNLQLFSYTNEISEKFIYSECTLRSN